MRPAARLAAAIDVLDAWQSGLAVEQALSRWARGARYAGSKDRAAVRDHVFDVLRRKGSSAAAGGGSDGRALILGLVRLNEMDTAEMFAGNGHGPAALSADEASFVAPAHDPTRDVPTWTHDMLRARASEDLLHLLEHFIHRAPVWVRVNLRRSPRVDVVEMLAEDGIVAHPHATCETALEVTEGARRLRQSRAMETGVVELQDLSVQRAIAGLSLPETGRILDYCAGGGGKALAIADRTDAGVTAHDANLRRMNDIAPRAARAGVEIMVTEASHLRGPFDLVLTDVPCSGSGTWRRDPEAKWRLTPERLAELTQVQDTILDEASAFVGQGGSLVYMTCSLFEVENEARISAFLGRSTGWTCTGQTVDTPLTASDGFFTAVLQRN